MKVLYWILAALSLLAAIYLLRDVSFLKSKFTKCEESVIGTDASVGRCAYPAHIMRIKGVWICSCRGESETKGSIE